MGLLLAVQMLPETPTIITVLSRYFSNSPWAAFLYKWEDIFFSLLISLLLSLLFYFGALKRELIPSGLQNFLEWIVENFRTLIIGILGSEGEKSISFLGILFIYILSMNLFGLIPLMKSPSSNLNITFAMAICVFAYVQYLNIKNMGVKGFLYHLIGSPTNVIGWIIAPLMFFIELLTQLSRPVTLALRLFGNILGEKILIGFFALIGVTLLYFIPIQTPFMFLGLLTSIMQAMVFTLLSTIYILVSMPHQEDHINH